MTVVTIVEADMGEYPLGSDKRDEVVAALDAHFPRADPLYPHVDSWAGTYTERLELAWDIGNGERLVVFHYTWGEDQTDHFCCMIHEHGSGRTTLTGIVCHFASLPSSRCEGTIEITPTRISSAPSGNLSDNRIPRMELRLVATGDVSVTVSPNTMDRNVTLNQVP